MDAYPLHPEYLKHLLEILVATSAAREIYSIWTLFKVKEGFAGAADVWKWGASVFLAYGHFLLVLNRCLPVAEGAGSNLAFAVFLWDIHSIGN